MVMAELSGCAQVEFFSFTGGVKVTTGYSFAARRWGNTDTHLFSRPYHLSPQAGGETRSATRLGPAPNTQSRDRCSEVGFRDGTQSVRARGETSFREPHVVDNQQSRAIDN